MRYLQHLSDPRVGRPGPCTQSCCDLHQVTSLVRKSVEAIGESPRQPMHSGRQIRFGALQRQLEVVAHHGVRGNAPTVAEARLVQSCQESTSAAGGFKNVAAGIAAINDIVKGVWKEQSKSTGHLPNQSASRYGYQLTNPPKSGLGPARRPQSCRLRSDLFGSVPRPAQVLQGPRNDPALARKPRPKPMIIREKSEFKSI
jgi:hypothetical protein